MFTQKRKELLRKVTTVKVSGTARFVAKDHLKLANVGRRGSNFNYLFLNKVEENVLDATLMVSCLERASLDAPILTELGDKAETKLAYLFCLLEKQSKGEDGVLLVNGIANIFYVRDANGKLWAVDAYWGSDGGYWRVEASSIGSPSGWRGGGRVFSRDS